MRRRDRINEKMRALQELIPNCNKVDKIPVVLTILTGKHSILSPSASATAAEVPTSEYCSSTSISLLVIL